MTDLWNSSAGPKYFLLRGGFNVGRGMDMARLQMITKKRAHITEQGVAQISTLWACKTEHFFSPMAPGAVPGDARAGTLRQADRSANDGDRVRHGFGSVDLR